MVCNHLKELYQLCQQHNLRFSGSDMIRIVCKECDAEETCPSLLTESGLKESSWAEDVSATSISATRGVPEAAAAGDDKKSTTAP